MVGFDPKQQFGLTEQFKVGAATSIASRFFVQPLDVVKIRLQLQHEKISKKSVVSKYKSVGQCISTIFKEEGLFGLWKGHLSGQILSFSFVTTQFMWFQQITKASYSLFPSSYNHRTKKLKPSAHFVCGGIAAGLTVMTSQPLDVIRTRLVAQGEPKLYKGMTSAARLITLNEGIRGLYRGTLPSILLTAPEAAFRFGIYQSLNDNWLFPREFMKSHIRITGDTEALSDEMIDAIQSAVNGGISGVFSKTIVYPFDLIKKRLQIQGFEEARIPFGRHEKFTGLLNCFMTTVKQEGVFGLYKGYLPSLVKAWVSSGLVFFFYEQFTKISNRVGKKN